MAVGDIYGVFLTERVFLRARVVFSSSGLLSGNDTVISERKNILYMSEECTKVKEYLIKIGFLIKDFTIYLYLKIFNILSISTTLINLICFNAA